MKKIFTLIILVFSMAIVANAQDTLLYQGFNSDIDLINDGLWSGSEDINTAPSGHNQWGGDIDGTNWINLDNDGIPDANDRPGGWYWTENDPTLINAFCYADSLAGGIMMSSSWLQNFDPNCSNYLISPAVKIDSGAVLSWKSAPFQTPLYLDGYSVWISTTDNLETSFTDMIFEAAEFVSSGTDSTGTGDYSLYQFEGPVSGSSTAWVHGADGMYTEVDTTDMDMTRLSGCLAPHSYDLSAYNGQTIHVAIFHGSHDDNILGIDDILITGYGGAVNIQEATSFEFEVFPNPTSDNFKLTYELPNTAYINIALYDNAGKLIETYNQGTYMAGSHSFTADVSKLPAGVYSVVVKSDNLTTSKQIIIQ